MSFPFSCSLLISAPVLQANGAASGGFRKEHPGTSATVFQVSSFTYLAMLGIGPLVLAPVSETFGRRPQITICTFMCVSGPPG